MFSISSMDRIFGMHTLFIAIGIFTAGCGRNAQNNDAESTPMINKTLTGQQRCNDGKTQKFEDERWQNVDDCKSKNQACTVVDGSAKCVAADESDKTDETSATAPSKIVKGNKKRLDIYHHAQKECPHLGFHHLSSTRVWQDMKESPKNKVVGVDVSYYQGMIKWDIVKESGIQFAYIKASEGITVKDACFKPNWDNTKENGLPRGAYHVFHFKDDGVEQAKNFLFVTGNTLGDLPAVIDLETRLVEGHPINEVVKRVDDWLQYVEKETGKKPMIYAGESGLHGYFRNQDHFSSYKLWFAHYDVPKPNVPAQWGHATFWQFVCDAVVEGIPTLVDLDRFSDNKSQLSHIYAR